MKDLYVHGIVKDYDKSINSINKYLFSENENLNAKIDELEERIDKAIEYIKENSYIVQDKEINGIPLMSKRLDKCDDLLEILGDKENE